MNLAEIGDKKARAYLAAIFAGIIDIEAANYPVHGARSSGGKPHSTPPGRESCPRAWAATLGALKYCAERLERESVNAIREVERTEAMDAVETVRGVAIEIPPPAGEWEDLQRKSG